MKFGGADMIGAPFYWAFEGRMPKLAFGVQALFSMMDE